VSAVFIAWFARPSCLSALSVEDEAVIAPQIRRQPALASERAQLQIAGNDFLPIMLIRHTDMSRSFETGFTVGGEILSAQSTREPGIPHGSFATKTHLQY
jgi:hypothetical protein